VCCFSGHVSDVSATNIFARVKADREYLVYEMTFTADEQTAMILPIPIAPGASEKAVEFVSLDGYASFFHDLEAHFIRLWSRTLTLGGGMGATRALKVQAVGAFEASFAPTLADLDRLDPRFRIPRDTWDHLPEYAEFGFVVFKLRPGKAVNVHPMAFSFPTRDPLTLFFPTLHIHDGTIQEHADFDHVFYTQNKPKGTKLQWPGFWWPGEGAAKQYIRVDRIGGLVGADAPCSRAPLVMRWKNADILIPIERAD